MLRVDKITLCLLEESLNLYLTNQLEKIPTLNMLNTPISVLENRANNLKERIQNICRCQVVKTSTMVGGGTTPNKKIPSIALSIEFENYKPNKIEKLLRENRVISRIENDKVLLDFRAILEEQIDELETILKNIFKSSN
jgi:L-seryl-tRNA(Ser) seleniumtransferase